MDSADVGMVEGRSRLRLALKPRQRLGIFGHVIRQELQRNKSVQPRVFGLVDNTHAAATELLDDAVVRDGLANHEAKTSPVGDEHGSSLPGSSQRASP